MKKTIAVFLSLALIFLNSSSSLAISKDNKKMTPKEKSVEVLIESGWTASEIADLDETELLTFENLKPAGGSETYYKIESNFKVKTVYDEKSQKMLRN